MALTKVSTDGVKDDAITKTKIPANQIEASELADNAVDTNAIADQAVALSKLPHGTSSNNGKFLRANNGADPSFETVSTDLVGDTSPQLGGDLASNGNDIVMADNDSIKLGGSTDFIMFHDSAGHTYIQDQGNGALRVRSDSEIALQKWDGTTNENLAKFMPDGAVELYHDGTLKVSTRSSGIFLQNLPDNEFILLDQNGRQSALNNYFSSGSTGSRIGVDVSTGNVNGAKTRSVDFWPNGMSFNGDTAAGNRLNDYEEGESVITAYSNNNVTINSSYNTMTYTKIGNVVTITGLIVISGVHSGNYFRINMPFQNKSMTNPRRTDAIGSVMHNNVTTGNAGLVPHLAMGSSVLNFYKLNDNSSWSILTNSDLASGDEMYFTITYKAQ